MVGAIHVEAVEVQRGGLVAQVVVGMDNDLITNIGLDSLQKLSVVMQWRVANSSRAPTSMGHFPFIPMTGRSNAPSGLARTQPILKSYVTVAAAASCGSASSEAATQGRKLGSMALRCN